MAAECSIYFIRYNLFNYLPAFGVSM